VTKFLLPDQALLCTNKKIIKLKKIVNWKLNTSVTGVTTQQTKLSA
jgi:hypothetical protein